MSDIPPEVSWEILLRLPAKSLFLCRSVSKAWLRIIDDPIFVKAHSMNHAYSHTLLMRNATGAPLYSFSLDSLNFIKGPQMIEATLSKQFQRRGSPLMPDLFQVASCNSLLLICNWDNQRIWAIWNPLTKESRGLPKPDVLGHLRGFGFGYDHHNDDYKVVRIEDMGNEESCWKHTSLNMHREEISYLSP